MIKDLQATGAALTDILVPFLIAAALAFPFALALCRVMGGCSGLRLPVRLPRLSTLAAARIAVMLVALPLLGGTMTPAVTHDIYRIPTAFGPDIFLGATYDARENDSPETETPPVTPNPVQPPFRPGPEPVVIVDPMTPTQTPGATEETTPQPTPVTPDATEETTPQPTPDVTPDATPQAPVTVNCDLVVATQDDQRATIRRGPSTAHDELDFVESGTRLHPTQVTARDFEGFIWYEVAGAFTGIGWIRSDLVQETCAPPTPAATEPTEPVPQVPVIDAPTGTPTEVTPEETPVIDTPTEPTPEAPVVDTPSDTPDEAPVINPSPTTPAPPEAPVIDEPVINPSPTIPTPVTPTPTEPPVTEEPTVPPETVAPTPVPEQPDAPQIVVEIINPGGDGATITDESQTAFEAIVYDASHGTENGTYIASVQFEVIAPDGTVIAWEDEFIVRYCAGGGDAACQTIPAVFASGQTGTFTLRVQAFNEDGVSSGYVTRTFVVPGPEAPATATPTEAAPTEAAPTEAAPTEAAPTEAAPTEAVPTSTPQDANITMPQPTAAAPGARSDRRDDNSD